MRGPNRTNRRFYQCVDAESAKAQSRTLIVRRSLRRFSPTADILTVRRHVSNVPNRRHMVSRNAFANYH
jgi:hypothetical protein